MSEGETVRGGSAQDARMRVIYRRRRVVVGAGLLLVVCLLVFGVSALLRLLSPQQVSTASGGQTQTSSASGADTSSGTSASPEAANAPQETPENASSTSGCAPDALVITPHTDALSYPPDRTPRFSLSIENVGKSNCVANLGTSTMVFRVLNPEGKEVWNSKHCQKNPDSRMVILEVRKPLATAQLSWDRSESASETCALESRPKVPASDQPYALEVTAGGVTSREPAHFRLEN